MESKVGIWAIETSFATKDFRVIVDLLGEQNFRLILQASYLMVHLDPSQQLGMGSQLFKFISQQIENPTYESFQLEAILNIVIQITTSFRSDQFIRLIVITHFIETVDNNTFIQALAEEDSQISLQKIQEYVEQMKQSDELEKLETTDDKDRIDAIMNALLQI